MSAARIELLSSEVTGRTDFARACLRVPHFRVPLALDQIPCERDDFDLDDRRELVERLLQQASRRSPHVAVVDSIRALEHPHACCVVTGQQPGLLGGPLYSLYKALHAIRLARSLAQTHERPVVPIFWNHADDHDIAEAHHAWLLNENLDLQRIGLAGLSSGKLPLSRIVFSEEKHRLSAARAAIEQTLGREPYAQEALELFTPREGESFAAAFTRVLDDLLGHLGLVVLEPDWIRESLSRSLAHIVGSPLATALDEGEANLRALGLKPTIESATAALMFHVDERGRHPLRLGGDGFRYDGEEGSRTATELASEIVTKPLEWSPGALLRPIVQDTCLPSVAYVGGWGEMSYLAQLGPLRRALGAPLTAAAPRWSCTLVDPQTGDAARQLGITLGEAIASRGAAAQVGVDEPPPPVIAELRRIAERASKDLNAQKDALAQLDRGIAINLGRTGSQIRSLVDKLCEKAERVHANRAGRGKRLVRRVTNTLAPRGELQERVLSLPAFVARFGRAWIDELFEAMGPLESGHLLVHLDDPVARAKEANEQATSGEEEGE
jgi:bacillithiol biosynthesis cysteine-adding enzyme BshC